MNSRFVIENTEAPQYPVGLSQDYDGVALIVDGDAVCVLNDDGVLRLFPGLRAGPFKLDKNGYIKVERV